MRLIDCDTHPLLPDAGSSLEPYLSEALAARLRGRQIAFSNPLPPSRYWHPNDHVLRPDEAPPGGGAPCSDPEYARQRLLEQREGCLAAMMLPIQAAGVSGWANPVEATGLASAFNDFFLDTWSGLDPRFKLNMVVAPQDPRAAAEEIRRLGGEEGVAGVWLPLLDILAGNQHYRPIFDAASECGLPVIFHPNGTEAMFPGSPSFAGGIPTTYAERFADLNQIAQSNLVSLIFEGVPEQFPNLKFIFTEFGWAWLPSVLWRMDTTWKAARTEVPWVTKAPSEYVREAFRFTTQPVDEPEHQREQIAWVAEMMHAGEVLMFSSDYPHWDSDEVDRVSRVMPEEIRERVMWENAAEAYGIGVPVAA